MGTLGNNQIKQFLSFHKNCYPYLSYELYMKRIPKQIVRHLGAIYSAHRS